MVISGVHSPSQKIGASDHGLASGERKKDMGLHPEKEKERRMEDF